MATTEPPKPNVLSISIKGKEVLYTAYMPYINGGAIFIPSTRDHKLGDELDLLINLTDVSDQPQEKFEVKGKIIWITPKGAGNRAPGIGVQFQGENAKKVQSKMEVYLASMLQSDKPTHTM